MEPQLALDALARRIRAHCLRMTHRAGASHVGSALSCAEILAVLYGAVLRLDPARPRWEERDRFLLSKGHAAAALYAVLAESAFFPAEWLDEYCQTGSLLLGHASHGVPGVELSTGSLGHALPVAAGMALGARRGGQAWRSYVLLSDGELDEGSNWEAALFAAHHALDNLTAIVDYNKIQSFGRVEEVLALEPVADKWRAFGWDLREVDGHDSGGILAALRDAPATGKPRLLLAHTTKGKGVSFMEDQLSWHYKAPDAAQLQVGLRELEVGQCAARS